MVQIRKWMCAQVHAYVNDEALTKFIACISLAVAYVGAAAFLRPYTDWRWLAADVATAVISVTMVGVAAAAPPEEYTIAAVATPGQEAGMWAVVAAMLALLAFCIVAWARPLAEMLPKKADFHPTFRFSKPSARWTSALLCQPLCHAFVPHNMPHRTGASCTVVSSSVQ